MCVCKICHVRKGWWVCKGNLGKHLCSIVDEAIPYALTSSQTDNAINMPAAPDGSCCFKLANHVTSTHSLSWPSKRCHSASAGTKSWGRACEALSSLPCERTIPTEDWALCWIIQAMLRHCLCKPISAEKISMFGYIRCTLAVSAISLPSQHGCSET
eukprot:3894099-Amphidinium_carterae.1